MINKEMLFEDVKFPLKYDSIEYRMYIFDDDNNMIAQVNKAKFDLDEPHPFDNLIGDYKEVEKRYEIGEYVLYQGDFYDLFDTEPIGWVRGYGRLQYKDKPEERQDNIASYILNVINEK